MDDRAEHRKKMLLERQAMFRVCELIAQGWPPLVALDLVRFPDDVRPEPEAEPS